MGDGTAHPWQEDLGADSSELLVDEDMFKVVKQVEETRGEVRQRVVSALNPMILKMDAEVHEEGSPLVIVKVGCMFVLLQIKMKQRCYLI